MPAGGSREVLCPSGRIQAEAVVDCRAQCLFVVRTQTPNVILAGSDVHDPHIEPTPKCRDKIILIYQRVRSDRLVTRIALDLERDRFLGLCHLTLSPQRWVTPSGSFAIRFHCYKKDLPHSMQEVLSREVIKPQDGHILCDLI